VGWRPRIDRRGRRASLGPCPGLRGPVACPCSSVASSRVSASVLLAPRGAPLRLRHVSTEEPSRTSPCSSWIWFSLSCRTRRGRRFCISILPLFSASCCRIWGISFREASSLSLLLLRDRSPPSADRTVLSPSTPWTLRLLSPFLLQNSGFVFRVLARGEGSDERELSVDKLQISYICGREMVTVG